jgi:nitroimidazol reductase NimA-like FMN-containing flavoprotein (pyridoxamine 5'-phosphate oxidase superfamily)
MTEPSPPINRVRRRDRAVEDDAWIRSFLQQAPYGVVATDCDGQPFTNPLLFVYDQASGAIYVHTSRAGRIFSNIRQNPRVCLNASRMGELMAKPEACEFDVEYDSVVVFGRARVLEDEAEAARALYLLIGKYFPHLRRGRDYPPLGPTRLAATAVYRLDIECWSGKRNANTP